MARQARPDGHDLDHRSPLLWRMFGEGKTYFGKLADGHLMLDDPQIVQGRRAVHLRFGVRRPGLAAGITRAESS